MLQRDCTNISLNQQNSYFCKFEWHFVYKMYNYSTDRHWNTPCNVICCSLEKNQERFQIYNLWKIRVHRLFAVDSKPRKQLLKIRLEWGDWRLDRWVKGPHLPCAYIESTKALQVIWNWGHSKAWPWRLWWNLTLIGPNEDLAQIIWMGLRKRT